MLNFNDYNDTVDRYIREYRYNNNTSKEKMLIISMFDRKSKEEKALELIKKKLGIGAWAVGGTNAIYLYNAQQYERDRIQRAEMGLNDFSQIPEAQVQDNFYQRNASYNVVQTDEDNF